MTLCLTPTQAHHIVELVAAALERIDQEILEASVAEEAGDPDVVDSDRRPELEERREQAVRLRDEIVCQGLGVPSRFWECPQDECHWFNWSDGGSGQMCEQCGVARNALASTSRAQQAVSHLDDARTSIDSYYAITCGADGGVSLASSDIYDDLRAWGVLTEEVGSKRASELWTQRLTARNAK